MAQVIRSNNPVMVANSLLSGGVQDPSLTQYLADQYNTFKTMVGNTGSAIANSMQNVYDYYNNSSVIEGVRNLIVGSAMGDDTVHCIQNRNRGNTSMKMRSYLMSNPTIYGMYMREEIWGWGGDFQQPEDLETTRHWDDRYLEVVDGVLQFEEDDSGYMEYVSTENEHNLTLLEKSTIIDSWEYATEAALAGDDVTEG